MLNVPFHAARTNVTCQAIVSAYAYTSLLAWWRDGLVCAWGVSSCGPIGTFSCNDEECDVEFLLAVNLLLHVRAVGEHVASGE